MKYYASTTTGLSPTIHSMDLSTSDSLEKSEVEIGDKRTNEEDIKALDENEANMLQEEIKAFILGSEALKENMKASVDSKDYQQAAEMQLHISKHEEKIKILNEKLVAGVELYKRIELEKTLTTLKSLINTGTISGESVRRKSRNSFQARVNDEVNRSQRDLRGAVEFFEILATDAEAKDIIIQAADAGDSEATEYLIARQKQGRIYRRNRLMKENGLWNPHCQIICKEENLDGFRHYL